jgi:hypothetical protein
MADVITLLPAGTGASVTGAAHDTGDLKDQATLSVMAAGVAAAWTVQLQGSVDGINYQNIGAPLSSAGVIGAAGPAGSSVLGLACAVLANSGVWRYFKAVSGGNTTVTVSATLAFGKT